MHIIQELDKDSGVKPYRASTKWVNFEGTLVTTYGSSDHSFAEAIGNMIIQMSASSGNSIDLSFINDKGQIVTQKKLG